MQAAIRIAPAAYYYTVDLNGKPIGAAMSTIDTTTNRIVASDFFTGKYPIGSDTLNIAARARASYSRALLLKDFSFHLKNDSIPISISGRTVGDTILFVETNSPGDRVVTSRIPLLSPAFTPTIAAVVGLLSRDRNAGDTLRVSLYDPLARELRLVTIEVHEDSLFRIADSATLDRRTNTWHASNTDTIRARRLGSAGGSLTVWVDSDGRIVAATEAGGLRMIRTAYELAFRRKKPDAPAARRPAQ